MTYDHRKSGAFPYGAWNELQLRRIPVAHHAATGYYNFRIAEFL